MANRDFRKGRGGLLKEAVSRICVAFNTEFVRDDTVPIFQDKYGYIAIPITDGFQSFYLMARSYLFKGNLVSIEKSLIEEAHRRKMRFIMWIGEIDKWYIFDPKDILYFENHTMSNRGNVEYLDFEAERLNKGYQIKFVEPKHIE